MSFVFNMLTMRRLRFIMTLFCCIPNLLVLACHGMYSFVGFSTEQATIDSIRISYPTEDIPLNSWGTKFIRSPFNLGVEIQTKYIWRGIEMTPIESSPVLFPILSYSWKNISIYGMGGYSVNGKYAEVDLGISYAENEFIFGVNDYYYPTIDSKHDNYFSGKKNTGHWLEAYFTYIPRKLPIWFTLSNFLYGADKYTDDKGRNKQAYSTYFEVGGCYDFLEDNKISLVLGMSLNKSCYNGYKHDFSICNLELKYTYYQKFKSGWKFPLSVSYIYNPVFNKSHMNFIAHIAF